MKSASIEYRMFGEVFLYKGEWPGEKIEQAIGEAMAKSYSVDRRRDVRDAGASIEELITLAGGEVIARNSIREDGSIQMEDFKDLRIY